MRSTAANCEDNPQRQVHSHDTSIRGRRCTQPCVLRMRVYQWPWSAVLPALIPNSPGFLTTPQELLVWSARHEGATYVRAHPTLQVMRRSRDVGKPNNHEACSLGRTRDHSQQSSNKRSVGDTPLSEVSKASVLHMGMHPPSGDSLSYAGSEGVLLDGGGGF